MTIQIPQKLDLKGDKVSLLPLDFKTQGEQIRRILSDPKTMEHLRFLARLPKGWAIEEIQKLFEKRIALQKGQEGLFWTIALTGSGEIVGQCGFKNLSLEHRNAEFGIILDPSAWKKGLSEECFLLSLNYAFETLNFHRVEFTTVEKNMRARTFLERLGIQQESIRKDWILEEGKFKDSWFYALFEDQWLAVKDKLVGLQ